MRITKAKQKEFLDSCRVEQIREYEEKLNSKPFLAIVDVPLYFRGHHIFPAIEGNEIGQGWLVLMYFWHTKHNEPWAKVGIYKQVKQ